MITYPPARTSPFEPPEVFRILRESSPIVRVRLWDGNEPWLLTRYSDIRTMLSDPRLSAVATRPGYPHITAGVGVTKRNDTSFLRKDAPEHDVERRMVAPNFSVRRIESMRPNVQRIVDDALDRFQEVDRPADLIQKVALPIPSLVICELLGVPYSDHEFFQERSQVKFGLSATPDEVAEALNDLSVYLGKLVAVKVADPSDDLISDLVTGPLLDGSLSKDEIVVMARLMLTAGHETTANMIGLIVFLLLHHPDQLAQIRTDSGLVKAAVEELLRYTSIAHLAPVRVASEDLEIGGQIIRAGEGVILPLSAANWDEEVFPQPDRLDIHRPARNHLAFGFGSHSCIGQSLARLELEIVVTTLFRRLPTLSLVDSVADTRFKYDGLFFGVHELPVTW